MVKVLILFYSTYGHLYQLAEEIAKGVREIEGAEVDLKQIPETFSDEVLAKVHATEAKKAFAHIPVATPNDLPNYDAIFFGTPGKYGNVTSQYKDFLDQCGGLWMQNALEGKVAAAFTCTGTQHGGQEATLLAMHPSFFHFGMVVVGLPYSIKEQMNATEITGGSPYGLTSTSADGSRFPSENERVIARKYGAHVATIAQRLSK